MYQSKHSTNVRAPYIKDLLASLSRILYGEFGSRLLGSEPELSYVSKSVSYARPHNLT